VTVGGYVVGREDLFKAHNFAEFRPLSGDEATIARNTLIVVGRASSGGRPSFAFTSTLGARDRQLAMTAATVTPVAPVAQLLSS